MLKEKLLQDFKEAMKEKNDKKLMAFRLLKAAFVNAEKVDGNKIDELKQIKIINKMISDCKNSADIYKKANRVRLLLFRSPP